MCRRVLTVFLVFSVFFSSVVAQSANVTNIGGYVTPPGFSYVPPLTQQISTTISRGIGAAGAISNTAGSLSAVEVKTLSTGSNITRTFTAGKRILSRGNLLLLGATVIVAGLDYYYNTMKQAASTPVIDAWRNETPMVVARVRVSKKAAFTEGYSNFGIYYESDSAPLDAGTWVANSYTENKLSDTPIDGFLSDARVSAHADWLSRWTDARKMGLKWVDGWRAGDCAAGAVCQEALLIYPDAATWVGAWNASSNWFASNWPAIMNHATTQPNADANSIPGVQVDADGGINKNQWTDDLTDPYLDTDGDGFSDLSEFQLGHLPIAPFPTPYAPPPPEYDPNWDSDNDGYSDKNEDDNRTPLNNPNEHPPGKPDRPLEPWEEDPRLHDPPPADAPGSDPDGDGASNEIDYDDDGDGIPDTEDPEPYVPDSGGGSRPGEGPQDDPDGDGIPNESDPDSDGDGIPNERDDKPYVPYIPGDHPTEDPDGDGRPNSEDPNPMVPDPPPGEAPTEDPDSDGIPNETDTDDDNDGIPDTDDSQPYVPYVPGDHPTEDPDGDGIPNSEDPNPMVPDPPPNPGTDPTPGDGIDPSPGDQDGDGVPDSEDPYITPPDPTPGDGIQPTPGDGNGDGVPDSEQPPDPGTGTDPTPGDGIDPTPGDQDGDGVPDSEDPYVTPPDPTPGDGIQPTPGDGNGDGVPDAEQPPEEVFPGDLSEQSYERTLDLPQPQLFADETPFTQLSDHVSQRVGELVTLAGSKFPFGLGSWIPVLGGGGGTGACEGIKMSFLGIPQEVGICGTPIDAVLAGPMRGLLLALFGVAFVYASARVMASS